MLQDIYTHGFLSQMAWQKKIEGKKKKPYIHAVNDKRRKMKI